MRPEKEVDGRVVRHHLLAQDETRPTVRSVFDGQAPNETLFNVLWTAPQWSEEDAEAAQLFLYRETVDAERRAMAASAVTLRLFASFDDRQFAWLCEAVTQKTDAVLRIRALTGAVLVAENNKRGFRFSRNRKPHSKRSWAPLICAVWQRHCSALFG